MPYPRRLLTEGEEIVVELRPHWVVLARPVLATAAAVALSVGLGVVFSSAPVGMVYVLAAIAALPAIWLAVAGLKWRSTSIVLTSERLLRTSGVVVRRGEEVRLERVNQLSYTQSLLGRVLREGELVVEVGGETGVHHLEHVPKPAVLQSLITEQLGALRRREGMQQWGYGQAGGTSRLGGSALGGAPYSNAGAGPGPSGEHDGATPPGGTPRLSGGAPGGAPGGGIAQRLATLQDLHARGLVSEEEYAAKRAELLSEL